MSNYPSNHPSKDKPHANGSSSSHLTEGIRQGHSTSEPGTPSPFMHSQPFNFNLSDDPFAENLASTRHLPSSLISNVDTFGVTSSPFLRSSALLDSSELALGSDLLSSFDAPTSLSNFGGFGTGISIPFNSSKSLQTSPLHHPQPSAFSPPGTKTIGGSAFSSGGSFHGPKDSAMACTKWGESRTVGTSPIGSSFLGKSVEADSPLKSKFAAASSFQASSANVGVTSSTAGVFVSPAEVKSTGTSRLPLTLEQSMEHLNVAYNASNPESWSSLSSSNWSGLALPSKDVESLTADLAAPSNQEGMPRKISWNQLVRNFKPDANVAAKPKKVAAASYAAVPASIPEQREKGSYITQQLVLPMKENESPDENLGELCRSIMEETGTSLEVSASRVSRTWSFLISGPADKVSLAKAELHVRLHQRDIGGVASGKFQIAIALSSNDGRKWIQNSNKFFSMLFKSHHTRVRQEEDAINVFSMDEVNFSNALQEIEKNLNGQHIYFRYRKVVFIEKSYHPFIYGVNQSVLKAIMASTHTRIQFPGHYDPQNSTRIIIEGENINGVLQAVSKITSVYEEKKASTDVLTLSVKKNLHKFLIGSKGKGLQDILEKTECAIELPLPTDPSDVVLIRGPPDSLRRGLALVMDKANAMKVESFPLNDLQYKYLSLRERPKLRELEERHLCLDSTLTLNGEDSLPNLHIILLPGLLELQGARTVVDAAVPSIQSLLDYLESSFYEKVSVPIALHKHIIGKRGQNISRFHDEFGVDIIVPNESEKSQDVLLVGKDKESIDKVSKELLSICKSIDSGALNGFSSSTAYQPSPSLSSGAPRQQQPPAAFSSDQQAAAVPSSAPSSLTSPVWNAKKCLYQVSLELASEKCAKNLSRYFLSLKEQYHVQFSIDNDMHVLTDDYGSGTPSIKESRSFLLVEGPNARDVSMAYSSIIAFLPMALETDSVTAVLPVPHYLHSSLIGKGGRNVRSLMSKFNVFIKFVAVDTSVPAGGDGEAIVEGAPKDVDLAMEELREITSKASAGFDTDPTPLEDKHFSSGDGNTLHVPLVKLAFLNGSKGTLASFVSDIYNTFGVTSDLSLRSSPESLLNDKAFAYFALSSSDASNAAAIARVRFFINSKIAELGSIKKVTIPPSFHPALIGLKGGRIRDVLSCVNNRVKIKFPRNLQVDSLVFADLNASLVKNVFSNDDEILLCGSDQDCEYVAERLMEIYAAELNLSASSSGEQAAYRDASKGTSSYATSARSSAVNSGRSSPVVGSAAPLYELSFSLPQQYHRYVVGRKGHTIISIMGDTDTQIMIPSSGTIMNDDVESSSNNNNSNNDLNTIIKIIGTHDNVLLAKQTINSLLLDIINTYHLYEDPVRHFPPFYPDAYSLHPI